MTEEQLPRVRQGQPLLSLTLVGPGSDCPHMITARDTSLGFLQLNRDGKIHLVALGQVTLASSMTACSAPWPPTSGQGIPSTTLQQYLPSLVSAVLSYDKCFVKSKNGNLCCLCGRSWYILAKDTQSGVIIKCSGLQELPEPWVPQKGKPCAAHPAHHTPEASVLFQSQGDHT